MFRYAIMYTGQVCVIHNCIQGALDGGHDYFHSDTRLAGYNEELISQCR